MSFGATWAGDSQVVEVVSEFDRISRERTMESIFGHKSEGEITRIHRELEDYLKDNPKKKSA